MCLICEHLDKKTLTFEEAWNNLSEMKETLDEDHFKKVQGAVFRGLDDEQYCLFCQNSPCACNWDEWDGIY